MSKEEIVSKLKTSEMKVTARAKTGKRLRLESNAGSSEGDQAERSSVATVCGEEGTQG